MAATLIWALGPIPAAWAHPHIFVDARAGFLLNAEGQLHALHISWTYDAFTSLFLFDTLDLDADGDGLLSDADRAAIVAGETQWPEDYLGDTYLEIAGQDRPLTRPQNGAARLEGDSITVTFDLPLASPADLSEEGIILRLYDPNFYYAYTILGDQDLSDPLPDGCRLTIIPFAEDDSTTGLLTELSALSREEVPQQENVGRLFSDEVRLECR